MLPQPLSPSTRFKSTSYNPYNVPQEELGAAQKLFNKMLYSLTVLPEDVPNNTHSFSREQAYYPAPSRCRQCWMA